MKEKQKHRDATQTSDFQNDHQRWTCDNQWKQRHGKPEGWDLHAHLTHFQCTQAETIAWPLKYVKRMKSSILCQCSSNHNHKSLW